MRKTRSAPHLVQLMVILGILVALQFFVATLNTSQAAYYGIQFGTEAAVSSDPPNDVWQLEKLRYTYIANDQIKPEVDLLGLHIERNANISSSYQESIIKTLPSIDNATDYNQSYSFDILPAALLSVSLIFITNKTYSSSALELYDWTLNAFVNQSQVTNYTHTLTSNFYSSQKILIHFNITNTQPFGFWYNLTFVFSYQMDQIVSIQFASLTLENSSLVDNLRAWIFLDTDGDDKLNYAVQWVYGHGAFLHQIDSQSFTISEPSFSGLGWNGVYASNWAGIKWVSEGIPPVDLSVLDYGMHFVNVTIPEFLVNLTSAVHYAVWSQKNETNYDWWDALPDDPNWEIIIPIPGFQGLLLGLGVLIASIIFLGKRKASALKTKLI